MSERDNSTISDGRHASATAGGVAARLFRLLSPRERKQLLFLAPAVIVTAVLDTAGIASIAPFLGLLSDPHAIEKSRVLTLLYGSYPFSSHESFFFAVGLGVLMVLTFGNAFGAFTTWALLRFSWMRNHSLSARLLESYLHRPYSFFLAQNTSQLAQKVLAEVQSVVSGVVVTSLNLAARLVVITVILATLVFVDPVMAIGVGVVFGGVYGSLFWFVRRKLAVLGSDRVDAAQARFKLASEMLTGIKEVKLAGLEQVFLERYAGPSRTYADSVASVQVLAQLPRYALETVAFGGVLLMVLFVLRSGQPLDDVLPIVGLYAFASYRMLPALQQVFAALAAIRANVTALDVLVVDLADPTVAPPSSASVESIPFERQVDLEDVSLTYPTGEKVAVENLRLSIARGEWIALVGPTGSGKSTLVDLLLGLLEPQRGTLRVDGALINEVNVRAWQAHTGYVPQQIFLTDDTVGRNIAFGVEDEHIDQRRLEAAARIAQIHDFITSELPNGYATVVGERGIRLSGGQRQRLGIARAIYCQPRFLVLDEATSALDNDTEARVFEALRVSLERVSVVSIAHRLTTTRGFDRIYVVEGGKVVDSGTYDELCEGNSHFRAVRSGTKGPRMQPSRKPLGEASTQGLKR